MRVLSLQGISGGNGVYASQGGIGGRGTLGVEGTPWASEGNYGTVSLGDSVEQGGDGRPFNYETNAQVKLPPSPMPQPCPPHSSLSSGFQTQFHPPCRELWLSLATGQ